MEIQHLKLSDMCEALAKVCNDFEGQKEGSCFADNSNLGCPFGYQYGTTKKAEVLYEEDEVTSTVTSDSIEAGWHDQEECR